MLSDLDGMVIEFSNGLRYVVGRGFVRDGSPVGRDQWAKEIKELWHDDAEKAQHGGRTRPKPGRASPHRKDAAA